jgi:hypothetical protein
MALAIRALHRSTQTESDELLMRYLGALSRHGDPEPERDEVAPGHDVRTCAACGEHTIFRLDPDGGWAECSACGRAG